MKRTVLPVLMVTVAGSNLAWVVPFPVIFTSTTTASVAGAAGAAAAFAIPGTAAAAWDVLGLLPPPQAPATRARSVVSAVNRIADVLRYDGSSVACERVHNNRAARKTGDLPNPVYGCAVALSHNDDDTPHHAQPDATADLSPRACAAPRTR